MAWDDQVTGGAAAALPVTSSRSPGELATGGVAAVVSGSHHALTRAGRWRTLPPWGSTRPPQRGKPAGQTESWSCLCGYHEMVDAAFRAESHQGVGLLLSH